MCMNKKGYRENRYGTNRLTSTVRFCGSVRIARNRIVPYRFYNIIGPVQYSTILRNSYRSAKSYRTGSIYMSSIIDSVQYGTILKNSYRFAKSYRTVLV